MNPKEYIRAKEEQLLEWERSIEKNIDKSAALDTFRKKRDEMKQKLDTLKSDTGDRWDVVKMGVESAWAELKAAFETATQRDLHNGGANPQ